MQRVIKGNDSKHFVGRRITMVWNPNEDWKQMAASAHFDCKELAKLNKVSVRQLQRIFRSKLNRTPQDWLNEQRILAAREMLRVGEPIKKVALDLGFKQSSHFC